MSRVSCRNDENPENQADQFRVFFHKKRGVNQVPQKLTSSIAFFKSSQSGLPLNLLNTPMSRVSCRNDENPENQADQFRAFFHKIVLRFFIIWTTNPWHGGV